MKIKYPFEYYPTGFSKVSLVSVSVVLRLNNFGNYGNKRVTTEPPLPLSYASRPSSTAYPRIQEAATDGNSINQIFQSSNRKTSQSLLNTCGKLSNNSGIQLIANGEDAHVRDHPWIGAMFYKDKTASNKPVYICGASLVTNKVALTGTLLRFQNDQ